MGKGSPSLVVIADDDPDVTDLLCHRITQWGYRAMAAGTKTELMSILSRERPTLLLLDLRFGDVDGLELLRQLKDVSPELAVALLTAHGSIDTAVSAMRLGAYDFVTKPPDTNRLRILIGHAAEKERLADRVRKLESLVAATPAGLQMLGESPVMQGVFSLLRSVAPTDATVLILGESGTGKELAARTVHELSMRKEGPFIPLNMAALPRELAESLLFGHEKGAFTGAEKSQAGACELADKGTLFLDEMGEMDLGLQAKLLRFLQDRTVQRVGNPKSTTVDVRVVAATNRDLLDRVRNGQFREDLYYRLNVVPIRLPPLRDRKADIPVLASTFLRRAVAKHSRDDVTISAAAIQSLVSYDWPGNIRQLENLIERAVILTTSPEIGPEAFAEEFRLTRVAVPAVPMETSPLGHGSGVMNAPNTQTPMPVSMPTNATANSDGLRFVDQIEKKAIQDALAKSGGNVQDASHQLGISQATVYRKLKRYGIQLHEFARA
ncbi:MAG: sigma-54 dependent transcriptional regulator [Gemmataceae bacterium]